MKLHPSALENYMWTSLIEKKPSSFCFTVSDRVLMSHWQKVHKSSPSSVAIMIFIFPRKISEMKVLINVGLFNSSFWASYNIASEL